MPSPFRKGMDKVNEQMNDPRLSKILTFVEKSLTKHAQSANAARPLILGIQGCQGSGKLYHYCSYSFTDLICRYRQELRSRTN